MSSSLAWASVASECTDSACATAYLLDSHRELGVSGVLKASLGTNLLRSPPVTAGPRLSLSGPRKTVPVNRIIVGRTVRHQLNAVSRRVSKACFIWNDANHASWLRSRRRPRPLGLQASRAGDRIELEALRRSVSVIFVGQRTPTGIRRRPA